MAEKKLTEKNRWLSFLRFSKTKILKVSFRTPVNFGLALKELAADERTES